MKRILLSEILILVGACNIAAGQAVRKGPDHPAEQKTMTLDLPGRAAKDPFWSDPIYRFAFLRFRTNA